MTLLKKNNSVLNATVIIGALGYFVDIYDKIIFSVVKKSSILSLKHWTPSNLDVKSNLIEYLKDSVTILDHQMIGMLLGGIFWGDFRRSLR